MTAHSALVVVTPAASKTRASGASLRVDDVRGVLEDTAYSVTVVTRGRLSGVRRTFCLGVAVSYANAGVVRPLRTLSGRVWLDAVDSWLLLNASAVRAGRPTYLLRGLRDALRLATMPTPHMVTWISAADRSSDRGTARGQLRCVFPGSLPATTGAAPVATNTRRVVLVGNWQYPPNRDGLLWFSKSVVPQLETKVDVFGAGLERVALPPSLVRHGYVSDTAALYQQGDVHVAPIRYGAGVKRKVLQPLLSGLPVVTTPAGAHGLLPHHLLDVCHTPMDMITAIMARLASPVAPLCPPSPAAVLDRDDTTRLKDWLRRCSVHR